MTVTVAEPRYRMYCGVKLMSSDGCRIGTLCVLDVVVRTLRLSRAILLNSYLRELARGTRFIVTVPARLDHG